MNAIPSRSNRRSEEQAGRRQEKLLNTIAAKIEARWASNGTAAPTITDEEIRRLSRLHFGVELSYALYAAMIAILLGDNGIPNAHVHAAGNRGWLAAAQAGGYDPVDVAHYVMSVPRP
jgi:hypothetical protein